MHTQDLFDLLTEEHAKSAASPEEQATLTRFGEFARAFLAKNVRYVATSTPLGPSVVLGDGKTVLIYRSPLPGAVEDSGAVTVIGAPYPARPPMIDAIPVLDPTRR